MDMVVKRGDIWLVSLEPTVGHEIRKTRPCVIISPDEANLYLDTVIAAPLTTNIRDYPSRVALVFKKKKGQVALDQIRSIDKMRLVKRLGNIDASTMKKIFKVLQEYFQF
jgi:mRNA interferase MazF